MIEFFEKILKKISNAKMTNVAFALGLCGIVLIAFSSFSGKSDSQNSDLSVDDENISTIQNTVDEYSQKKKKELESLLSQISGVGKVSVMVNVTCSEEYVYATFESGSENISPDSAENEYSYEYFTYKAQNGDLPLMTKILTPQIGSCVVACEGAKNAVVRERVYMAVSAALGIPVSDIYVSELS